MICTVPANESGIRRYPGRGVLGQGPISRQHGRPSRKTPERSEGVDLEGRQATAIVATPSTPAGDRPHLGEGQLIGGAGGAECDLIVSMTMQRATTGGMRHAGGQGRKAGPLQTSR
ncbi:hypothetical protein GCM10010517_44580 [Streptosporangium fragile]|uniref:Uncharacterized protein n=1 Tax=Streptosporangium fragile TaxID=46186 RepID=A0ABP6IKP8_9ACTN